MSLRVSAGIVRGIRKCNWKVREGKTHMWINSRSGLGSLVDCHYSLQRLTHWTRSCPYRIADDIEHAIDGSRDQSLTRTVSRVCIQLSEPNH